MQKISNYQRNKDRVRQFAIEWQEDYPNRNHSYEELMITTEMFERLGRRYGLMGEFHENGIC